MIRILIFATLVMLFAACTTVTSTSMDKPPVTSFSVVDPVNPLEVAHLLKSRLMDAGYQIRQGTLDSFQAHTPSGETVQVTVNPSDIVLTAYGKTPKITNDKLEEALKLNDLPYFDISKSTETNSIHCQVVNLRTGLKIRKADGRTIGVLDSGSEINNCELFELEELPKAFTQDQKLSGYEWGRGKHNDHEVIFAWKYVVLI